jgi:hypothetical protein
MISTEKKVVIFFSDSDTPPLYGDFFTVLMLVRFLSLIKLRVTFIICEDNTKGLIWEKLTAEEILEYKNQRIQLTKIYLGENSEVIFSANSKQQIIKTFNGKTDLIVDFQGLEAIAPYIVHLLIDEHKITLPKDYLLPVENSERVDPYVTWAIRKSKWRPYSDSKSFNVKRDYSSLRKLFPNHNIMIISNQEGEDFVFKTLFNLSVAEEVSVKNIKVLPQQIKGFVGGMQCVLGSDFYLQRSGGGMLVAAAYSNVPYLYFQEAENTFYGRTQRRSFTWSSSEQITIRSTKSLAKILPVKKFLNLTF